MRSIFVLDEMPDRCTHCELWEMVLAYSGHYHHYCIAQAHKMLDSDYVDKCLDEDCPLRPLPERKAEMDYLATGWNLCLDAIEEGADD